MPSISLAFNDGNIYKDDQFYLTQFHFHWGYNDYQGKNFQRNLKFLSIIFDSKKAVNITLMM